MTTYKRFLTLLVLMIFLAGCGDDLISKSVSIPLNADYKLIPVYTLDDRSVYLNAGVTPLLFFSIEDDNAKETLLDIQQMVTELKPQRPLVYIATNFQTSDVSQAIENVKTFINDNNFSGTVVIQAGDPQTYVKNVPALVSLDGENPKIIEGKPGREQLSQLLLLQP